MTRFAPLRAGLVCLALLSMSSLPLAAHPDDDHGRPPRALPAADGKAEAKPSAPAEAASPAAAEKKEEKPKWDVGKPPGPATEVSIDTDEGTWMCLDVSPDGKEIVFDLLGDLYVMPAAGGEAHALSTGVAWDMQPRFSPDGRSIAFTSDRSGGDNIWVMKRDGSSPMAVTKEEFRLLNSPSWSPDGQYIVARKHFTSQRSLGAGEMWLYHRSGGEGVQLTRRPNDQKDAGEPVFSPDGRYLYYSQDITPGPVFEYNKDPNGEIYVIQRLDLETGETVRFIEGPGGSIRPTPSHDGRQVAFVRRVRGRSVLHLHEVESGKERPLYDGLDRDMQETWAVHGVYPAMAWTPDDKALLFWAGGKIQRIDVATKALTTIPFHVRATRTVTEAVRFPQQVAPDRFPVKMLRWVSVSPDGKQVLFQALGHLYVRDLPEGTPRRLTRQDDHFEFYPAWSRDGKSIVYVTWHDRELGTVRVVSAKGGEGRVVTPKPGHYFDPVFTPDGQQVVYRKGVGGYLVTPTWSHEPGIYVVPVKGGEPRRITRKGFAPHFGRASDRVYLMDIVDDDRRVLVGIDLDGSDERTYVSSEAATEIRVSPDERWLAFRERFNAFVTPFVRTGKSIDLSPKGRAVPVKRVSKDAGDYLHWSGDSRKLYWSLGPELFSRELRETFDFLEGAPEKLPDPPERGLNIGFEARADVPSGITAFTGARIVSMKGDEVIEDGTVVVEGNRIKAVGSRDQVVLPAGAQLIDARGLTILPGLIDVHWHGGQGAEERTPQQNWINLAGLAFGVTTAHDPSNDTGEIFAAAELARAGQIVAPRLFSTGMILYGARGSFKAEIDSLDDALAHLRRMKAVGAFSVKSYNQPRRDQRQQVIAAARALEMMVVPEGGSLFMHNMTMVVDGHTGVEHAMPVAQVYRDVLQLWGASRTGYTPTTIVGYGGLWGEEYWYERTNVWEHPRLLTFVPRELVDQRSRRRNKVPEEEYNHLSVARIAKALTDAGVRVNLGAHGQREGLGAHWELWMLVQGGMSPLEALRAGTLNGARYLGLEADVGSLEPGKLADLIVLEKNPLEDIRHSESIRYTMVNGRLYDARTLHEVGNHPRKRSPLYWETSP